MSIPAKRGAFLLILLSAILALLFVLSAALGRYPLHSLTVLRLLVQALARVFGLLGQQGQPSPELDGAAIVLFRVRLPRLFAAMLVGAALASSGAAYQGLFRNPLVSPDVLGVSAGAAFGAAAAIFLGLGSFLVSLSAFAWGLAAAVSGGLLSRLRGAGAAGTLTLVLAGIMVGSLFTSATSFLKLVADPNNVLPAITYWLMGGLSSVKERDIVFAAPPILASLVLLHLLRWRLNVLTLGDDEARALGVEVRFSRALVILAATAATAAAVAVAGVIGWVGLVIPHFARLLAGSDYRRLMPASALLGAAYLLLVDNIARLATTAEIPLGILTSFVGIPFFLHLIRRGGRVL